MVVPVELCMFLKVFYKVLFTHIKTNPYFWSRSYGK